MSKLNLGSLTQRSEVVRQIQPLRRISFSNAVQVGLTTAAGSSSLNTNVACSLVIVIVTVSSINQYRLRPADQPECYPCAHEVTPTGAAGPTRSSLGIHEILERPAELRKFLVSLLTRPLPCIEAREHSDAKIEAIRKAASELLGVNAYGWKKGKGPMRF